MVDLGEAAYLAVEGHGSPEASLAPAMSAIYTVAYGLKFRLKRFGHDFRVCPAEAQWWSVDESGHESPERPPNDVDWHWRLLLMVPDFVTPDDVETIKASARTTHPEVRRVSLVRFTEGLAVQMLHIGPYDAEEPTIAAMLAFMAGRHLETAGRHHEVYLGDPRRAKPEKLRTLLRQPVRAKSPV
jgi:hypothetical protein